MAQKFPRTLFVIPSGAPAKRSHSVEHRFKSASDFAYLCGLHLSDAILVIAGDEAVLLHSSEGDALWGEFTDIAQEDPRKLQGLRQESMNRWQDVIRSYLGEADRMAVSLGRDALLDRTLLSLASYEKSSRRVLRSPLALCDSRVLVGALRLFKDERELAELREAGRRTSKVHRQLMRKSWIGKTEREISNWIEGHFLLENMPWTAYETIVGSGDRATVLHARATDRRVQKEELILIDAGGEWNGYCSDITRVIPSGLRFTSAQREVYEAVLAAHHVAAGTVKPGLSLSDVHEAAKETLIQELAKAGNSETEIRARITDLFPHQVGHWIGLDVHDPSPYVDESGRPLRLEKGMCLTIEPGLYFRDRKFLARYHGIGIRIEDNVVVTEKACERINDVPKEVEEIEALRGDSVDAVPL